MVHMGDQIYADRVLSQWRERYENQSKNLSEEEAEQAYLELLEQYRNVYRITFGQRTCLDRVLFKV